jgi:hypothetical protein
VGYKRSCIGYLSVKWKRAEQIPRTMTARYGRIVIKPLSPRAVTVNMPRTPRYADICQIIHFREIEIAIKRTVKETREGIDEFANVGNHMIILAWN